MAAADALAELIDETGTVMVVNVNPGISTTDQRQAGFEQEIATYPNIEYIGTEFSNNDPAKAAEIMTAAIAAHPDLNGVFAANLFSAQGTATGVQQANADVQVVGFDAGPARSTSSRPVTSRRWSSRSPTTSVTRASSRRSSPSTAAR